MAFFRVVYAPEACSCDRASALSDSEPSVAAFAARAAICTSAVLFALAVLTANGNRFFNTVQTAMTADGVSPPLTGNAAPSPIADASAIVAATGSSTSPGQSLSSM